MSGYGEINALGCDILRDNNGAYPVSINIEIADSSLGIVLVAITNSGVRAIQIGDDKADLTRELKQRFPDEDFLAHLYCVEPHRKGRCRNRIRG
jgi:hypothetical protein